MPTNFIPPLAVSRMFGSYHFEGGGYVAIVSDGNVSTGELLDKAQALIDLKRGELASRQDTPEGGCGPDRHPGIS